MSSQVSITSYLDFCSGNNIAEVKIEGRQLPFYSYYGTTCHDWQGVVDVNQIEEITSIVLENLEQLGKITPEHKLRFLKDKRIVLEKDSAERKLGGGERAVTDKIQNLYAFCIYLVNHEQQLFPLPTTNKETDQAIKGLVVLRGTYAGKSEKKMELECVDRSVTLLNVADTNIKNRIKSMPESQVAFLLMLKMLAVSGDPKVSEVDKVLTVAKEQKDYFERLSQNNPFKELATVDKAAQSIFKASPPFYFHAWILLKEIRSNKGFDNNLPDDKERYLSFIKEKLEAEQQSDGVTKFVSNYAIYGHVSELTQQKKAVLNSQYFRVHLKPFYDQLMDAKDKGNKEWLDQIYFAKALMGLITGASLYTISGGATSPVGLLRNALVGHSVEDLLQTMAKSKTVSEEELKMFRPFLEKLAAEWKNPNEQTINILQVVEANYNKAREATDAWEQLKTFLTKETLPDASRTNTTSLGGVQK